jgi:hypothetical protein
MLVNIGAEFGPGTCIITRKCDTIHFQIFKYIGAVLSIETDVPPVQIIIALNREGFELPFDQLYQAEVTTNPLGKHYITS